MQVENSDDEVGVQVKHSDNEVGVQVEPDSDTDDGEFEYLDDYEYSRIHIT